MLVAMATPISSHVKDKNSIFTASDEDMIFSVKGKILVFHQYLYNKNQKGTFVNERGHFVGVCLRTFQRSSTDSSSGVIFS